MTKYKGFVITKIAKRDRAYQDGLRYRATGNGSKVYGETLTGIKQLISKSRIRIEAQKEKIKKLRLDIKRKRESMK